jgi:hypothetical protein
MTDDHLASVEAWTRKKPRRIIQNQILIEMILAYTIPIASMTAIGILYLISIYPLTVAVILAIWSIAVISYLALCVVRKKMR